MENRAEFITGYSTSLNTLSFTIITALCRSFHIIKVSVYENT